MARGKIEGQGDRAVGVWNWVPGEGKDSFSRETKHFGHLIRQWLIGRWLIV